MEHTSNYELSKWAESDRIMMEDFNMDHDKIDAAIKAVETSGLKIMTGSFSGTGTTGIRTYSIGVRPKLLIARTDNKNGDFSHSTGICITDIFCISFSSSGDSYMQAVGTPGTLTDNGFSISISNAVLGLNASGSTLYYWALY